MPTLPTAVVDVQAHASSALMIPVHGVLEQAFSFPPALSEVVADMVLVLGRAAELVDPYLAKAPHALVKVLRDAQRRGGSTEEQSVFGAIGKALAESVEPYRAMLVDGRPPGVTPVLSRDMAEAFRAVVSYRAEHGGAAVPTVRGGIDWLSDAAGRADALEWLMRDVAADLASASARPRSIVDRVVFLAHLVLTPRYGIDHLRRIYDELGIRAQINELTMDVENAYGEAAVYGWQSQLSIQREIQGTRPDVTGQLAFEPRRADSLSFVKMSVGNHGFLGVFVAPDDDTAPDDFSRFDGLYAYCAAKDVPIMTYPFQAGWGAVLSRSGSRNNPTHWARVLERYPTLRLCYGHGGADPAVIMQCQTFENVYCSWPNDAVVGEPNPLVAPGAPWEALVQAIERPSAYRFGRKCMFGSGYPMPPVVYRIEETLAAWAELFDEHPVLRPHKGAFFADNARAYLRLRTPSHVSAPVRGAA